MFNRILLPLDRSALRRVRLAAYDRRRARVRIPDHTPQCDGYASRSALAECDRIRSTGKSAKPKRPRIYTKWICVCKPPACSQKRTSSKDLRRNKSADFRTPTTPQLIIMSSHGQSGLSGWNVSGVVLKIILRARTSIMIVRAYQPSSDGDDPFALSPHPDSP